MAGLILLIAFIAFMATIIWLSGPLTQWLPISRDWKAFLRLVIVVGVIPLMLTDEIIGKYQYEALCKANGIENADVSKARGKRVKLEVTDLEALVNTAVPAVSEEWIYRDADTNEILIRYKSFLFHGGWIMRSPLLGMESSNPIIFPSVCESSYSVRKAIFFKNNITLIN